MNSMQKYAAALEAIRVQVLDGIDESDVSALAELDRDLGRSIAYWNSPTEEAPKVPWADHLVIAAKNVPNGAELGRLSRILGAIQDVCTRTLKAHDCRKRGAINAAARYEARAEDAYNSLPAGWRW